MNPPSTCHGIDCTRRDTCRRYIAAPSIPPRWSSFDADRQRNGGACDGYWPIKVSGA